MGEKHMNAEWVEMKRIAYGGVGGAVAVYDEGEVPPEPPPGSVYRQEGTLIANVVLDGRKAKGVLFIEGPKTFLRGRVVTGREAIRYAPFSVRIAAQLMEAMDLQAFREHFLEELQLVAIRTRDGGEHAVPLYTRSEEGEGDTPPPAGVSEYAVGESPEEVAAAEARAYAEGCQEDLDPEDEVAQIRDAVKHGVHEILVDNPAEEEGEGDDDEDPVDADCFGDGGGHPTILPFPNRDDDGPRAA